jgi:hypothetical protein
MGFTPLIPLTLQRDINYMFQVSDGCRKTRAVSLFVFVLCTSVTFSQPFELMIPQLLGLAS